MAQDNGNILTFKYGIDGVIGFTYQGVGDFYYKKNIFGDIISIIDKNGQEIAKYTYAAWGNHKSYSLNNGSFVDISLETSYTQDGLNNKLITELNPFRYRGCYYDIETGFYYLNSRYYDSEIGRFINLDNVAILSESMNFINGLNLYAYCSNNPVMNSDSKGTSWWSDFWSSVKSFFKNTWDVLLGTLASIGLGAGGLLLTIFTGGALAQWGGALIGAGIGGFIGGIQNKLGGGSYWGGYLGGFISGGLTGLGAFLGPVGVFVGGALGNFSGTVVTDAINGVNLNDSSYWLNLAADTLLSGLIAIGSFKFGNIISYFNIPGFRDLYAGITVWAEFTFSYLFDTSRKILRDLAESIRRRFLLAY